MKALSLLLCTVAIIHASNQNIDLSSYANMDQVVATHYDINMVVNFNTNTVESTIVYTFKCLILNLKEVILDIAKLRIASIKDSKGNTLKYTIDNTNNIQFGQALHIKLAQAYAAEESFGITIVYSIYKSDQGQALNWLTPQYTAEKKYPYMFSNCETVKCRGLFPSQDTPSVKSTFQLTISVPNPLIALASAIQESNSTNGNISIFLYTQVIPVPTYLFAIVVGHIEYRQMTPRVGVYSEPNMVDGCAWELEGTEEFLFNAEKFYIPYVWGKYNLIVMPPSYPVGGMENPYLTFVSPTIITGDRSSVSTVAHEIGHSWSGNLMTNRNWTYFWLNEGLTVYTERKILGKVYGDNFETVQAYMGYQNLMADIKLLGADNMYTSLQPNIITQHPDDYVSRVPYEKGFFFIKYLESLTSKLDIEQFYRIMFSSYAYHTITHENFRSTFDGYVKANFQNHSEILKQIDWEKWFYGFGAPIYAMGFDKGQYSCVDIIVPIKLANEFLQSNGQLPPDYQEYLAFDKPMRMVFMSQLTANMNNFTEAMAVAIDNAYSVSTTETSLQTQSIWFQLLVQKNFVSFFDKVDAYLGKTGRTRFIKPIYIYLVKVNKPKAQQFFQEHKDFYDPLVAENLAKVVA